MTPEEFSQYVDEVYKDLATTSWKEDPLIPVEDELRTVAGIVSVKTFFGVGEQWSHSFIEWTNAVGEIYRAGAAVSKSSPVIVRYTPTMLSYVTSLIKETT